MIIQPTPEGVDIGGESTSRSVVGPEAVTDNEHGNRRGGGGFNPIDMRDPQKGVPGGASLEALGDAALH